MIADEVTKIIMEEGEIISAHVMSEKSFNERKSFSFLSDVLKDGVGIA